MKPNELTCPLCGATTEGADNNTCPFDVPKEQAPWLDDYVRMSTGEMSHEEHQVLVARWNLHHQGEVSPKVLNWAWDIVKAHAEGDGR